MTEHKAQDRAAERPLAGRAEDDRTAELPSRKGGFERMAREALRITEAPARAATEAPQPDAASSMMALMQETTRGLRAALMFPIAPGSGFIELQEAFAELVTGMVRNNLRLTQEVMRIYSPQEHADLTQKLMRQWLDAVVEGQTMMLRAARQTTDQALRPVEALQERQGMTTH